MSKFAKFTHTDSELTFVESASFLVPVADVRYVEEAEKGCLLTFRNGSELWVTEDIDTVQERLNA